MNSSRSDQTKRMVGISIFTALVIVLQLFSSFVRFGPFVVTLALTPIVVGGALYGARWGAFLGAVFGALVLAMCITGVDVGGSILWNVNPFMTAVLCVFKGAAAAFCGALVYKLFSKRSVTAGAIAAAIVVPLVNTGIFVLGMATVFYDTLVEWSGGADIVYYVLVGMVGVNFLVEVAVNAILSPAAARIIGIRDKGVA